MPALYSPTVYVLNLSWPDRDGKGLYSPDENQEARILLDGQPLWGKRTTQQSSFNHYYAAEHEPVTTTFIVRDTSKHTLTISVPAHTAWDLSSLSLSATPFPKTIRGIGYSPYRDCQSPGGKYEPSAKEIEEDLFRLVYTSTIIRTYSSLGPNAKVPAIANKLGLPVYAGA